MDWTDASHQNLNKECVTFDGMIETVIEEFFGEDFEDSGLFVEVVEEGNIKASGYFDAVAKAAKYPHVD